MGVSLKDIAEKLNLSKTTVSWVLSGQGNKKGISAETQNRVFACARELAYEPNLLARSLNTGISKTIGLILPPYRTVSTPTSPIRSNRKPKRRAIR